MVSTVYLKLTKELTILDIIYKPKLMQVGKIVYCSYFYRKLKGARYLSEPDAF